MSTTSCDAACPARALYRVDFWAGPELEGRPCLPLLGKLFFCGQHLREHSGALATRLADGSVTTAKLTC